jgi:hypothetical protein
MLIGNLNELIPPKAVPFQTRPITNWKGFVEISWPEAATPITPAIPHPRSMARLQCSSLNK